MGRKVVLVTGCTAGGIGACLAAEFAKNGYEVFASARRKHTMDSLPSEVHRVVLDVTAEAACQEAIKTVIQVAGRIDVLVNNAGMAQTGALLDTSIDTFKAHHETNVVGMLRMTQLAVPHMVKQGNGLIINVGSGLGYISFPMTGAYTASKHALHSLTDVMRLELNPLGIDVMLVVPGFVRTAMVSNPSNHPMSKASAFGYDAFAGSAGLWSNLAMMFASSPEALARKVVAAAGSFWGPPRHLTVGTGIQLSVMQSWMPLWMQDWINGLWYGMKPRWRGQQLIAEVQRRKASSSTSAAAASTDDEASRWQHDAAAASNGIKSE